MTDYNALRFGWLDEVHQDDRLSDGAKVLAAALSLKFFNAKSGQCNPSKQIIADHIKKHASTVQRLLRELRNLGWLSLPSNGGRSQTNVYRLRFPGGVTQFPPRPAVAETDADRRQNSATNRQKKGFRTAPLNDQKGVQNCTEKGFRTAPRKEPCKEPYTAQGRSNGPPDAVRPHMETRFHGNVTDGPRVVPKEAWDALNAWADFLNQHELPKLIAMPLVKQAENDGGVFFYLPSKTPPKDPKAIVEALAYFTAVIDFEADRHAAQ